MNALSLWVLAEPGDGTLAPLQELPADVRVLVTTDVEALRQAPPADVILACDGGARLLEQALALAPGLRWVHARWAGLDQILFPALVESPVPLTNSRGVFSSSLAEFALCGLLHFAKDLPRLERQRRAQAWQPFAMQELRGRTLGIVGYGDIGRAVARLARALGLRVLALRREPGASDELAEQVYGMGQRTELLARCDYVVVAAPLTAETRGLLGAAELQSLPQGAVLVNVGRGPVIDEAALVDALRSGHLRGAALDVFEREPLPAGHALWGLDNVLVSPHCADRVEGWLSEATRLFVLNFGHFRAGRELLNVVDKRRGY